MRLEELQDRADDVGRIPMTRLGDLRAHMPDDVLEQFVSDHGTKPEFLEQYGRLELTHIEWLPLALSASEVAAASAYERFTNWQVSMRSRVALIRSRGWEAIDTRPEVVRHWKAQNTWLRRPIFLDGALLGRSSVHHLVEGHGRTGILRALLSAGYVTPESSHAVWLGRNRRATA